MTAHQWAVRYDGDGRPMALACEDDIGDSAIVFDDLKDEVWPAHWDSLVDLVREREP